MIRTMLFCLLLVGMTSCVKRVPIGQPVVGANWAYVQIGDNNYHVFAKSQPDLDAAVDMICDHTICSIERMGSIWYVEVHP